MPIDYARLIMLIIKLILVKQLSTTEAVSRISEKSGVCFKKLFNLLPDVYKY
ncbi:MAG: hypothetical protein ACOCRO_06435 [Halanaerobiales bacterium]